MATKRKFKSDISEAIHSSAAVLHRVRALDKSTMRDFDARHLAAPAKIAPAQAEKFHEGSRQIHCRDRKLKS